MKDAVRNGGFVARYTTYRTKRAGGGSDKCGKKVFRTYCDKRAIPSLAFKVSCCFYPLKLKVNLKLSLWAKQPWI
jgi:hypothetical protein